MTTYIEYAVSAGHGTLVEHGVAKYITPSYWDFIVAGLALVERITPERYSEFIQIHGSERAI